MRTDELWCNGSTTDSDSVCLGSNPGSSTKIPCLPQGFLFLGASGEVVDSQVEGRIKVKE